MDECICPHCKRPIYDEDALLCLYCGNSLRRSVGLMGKMRYPTRKIYLIAVIIAIVFGFIILVMR